MTNESVQIVNKLAFLEVSEGEVLIPIATNFLIELSPASRMLPKTPTMSIFLRMTQLFQHQIDLLRQELEKNITANNDFKNFLNKNWRMKERLKLTRLKFFMKELKCFKRKISALITKLKVSKRR